MDKIQQIIKLNSEKLNDSEISRKLGINRKEVKKIRLLNNIPSNMRILSDKDKNDIYRFYAAGHKVSSIARMLKCTETRVHKIIKGANSSWKQAIKENPFINLNNEDVRYWLGMLASDGCINGSRVVLSLKGEDEELLIKFKEFLGSDKITVFRGIHKKEFPYSRVSFRNLETVKHLTNLGIKQNKTKDLLIYFPIDINYLRGYIDGDGYIDDKGNRISISIKSKEHAKQISDFLSELEIQHGFYDRKRIFTIEINRHLDVFKLISLLYFNAHTFMKRKYDKACQIRNNLMKRFQSRGTSIKNPEPSSKETREGVETRRKLP